MELTDSTSSYPSHSVWPLSLTMDRLSEYLGGSGKSKLFWSMIRDGINPTGAESTLSLRVQQHLQTTFGSVLDDKYLATCVNLETVSTCGGRKQLHTMQDGLQVESVIIPHNVLPRSTVCVSNQIGCDRGCIFCATGKMGLVRNLTPDEILSQVFWAKKSIRENNLQPLRNIVFMGMGDIGRNLESVRTAVDVLTDHNRFAIAPSKVTLSTVGPDPEIFSELAQMPGTLAWSLHSAVPEIRKKLVPSSRFHDPSELRDGLLRALLKYKTPKHRSILVAITLLKGINTRQEDAEALAVFLQPLRDCGVRVCVDLIPYNNIGVDELQRPDDHEIEIYKNVLQRDGFVHSVRLTRGEEDASACGMLATSRKPRTVDESNVVY